jgi:AcrR family transcriptional regulator
MRIHLPKDERQNRIVAAVLALAARQEPAAITTAAIAGQMGVTQGALFRHFDSKDAVWRATMEWVARTLSARLDAAADAAPSPLGALESMFVAHAGFVAEHPGVPRLIFAELQRPMTTPARAIARDLVEAVASRVARRLEAAKAAGEADPALDVRAAALLFVGAVQGLVMQSLLMDDPTRLSAARDVFALYARVLTPRLTPPAQGA